MPSLRFEMVCAFVDNPTAPRGSTSTNTLNFPHLFYNPDTGSGAGFFSRMRLIKQNIERKTGAGSATLLPEEPEDMVSESVSTD